MTYRKQEKCAKGHEDWMTAPNGNRRCRTCHNDRNRQRRRGGGSGVSWAMQSHAGDQTSDETFTYHEIMKARGYVQ